MKTLKLIKKILVSIVLIVFFAFTITMTVLLLNYNKYGVTQFEDKSLIIVKKGFTSETYQKGSLVIVESDEVKNYEIGEELFVYHLDGHGGVSIELGKIGQIHEEDKAVTFENGETYSEEFIIGAGEKIYKNIGKYLSIVESKWGFLFIILIPNFFLFVFQLYSLIIEVKYGKEEDEETSN